MTKLLPPLTNMLQYTKSERLDHPTNNQWRWQSQESWMAAQVREQLDIAAVCTVPTTRCLKTCFETIRYVDLLFNTVNENKHSKVAFCVALCQNAHQTYLFVAR